MERSHSQINVATTQLQPSQASEISSSSAGPWPAEASHLAQSPGAIAPNRATAGADFSDFQAPPAIQSPSSSAMPTLAIKSGSAVKSGSAIKIVAGGGIWSNLTALSQQLSQLLRHTSNSPTDLPKNLFKASRLIGSAFGVEGCAVLLPAIAPLAAQVAYWVAQPPRHELKPKVLPTLYQTTPFATVRCADLYLAELHTSTPENIGLEALLNAWNSINSVAQINAVRAVVGIPIDLGDRGTGLLTIMRTEPYNWNDPEVHSLTLLADQLGLALAQLPLQQQIQQQAHYQAAIHQVAQAIHATQPLEEIFPLAIARTAQVLQAQRGLLLRLKYWDPLLRYAPEGALPKARISIAQAWQKRDGAPRRSPAAPPTTPEPESGLSSFWLSECDLCQQVFRQLSLLASQPDQPLRQQLALSQVAAPFQLEDYPAFLMAPLEHQGRVLGFLLFQHSKAQAWTTTQQDLVRLMASQLSTAIIQTETLRQVQSMVDKRTAELKESLTIQAKLYERTRQQIDQLRHLNQLKDEFLSTVSHELKTPLTTMTMAIKMLRSAGTEGDRAQRYLQILEDECNRESELVKDLLMMQEVECGKMALQPTALHLNEILEQQVSKQQAKWASKQLVFDLELPATPLMLETDATSLIRIVRELLTNASKFAAADSTITCTLSSTPTEVVLKVQNLGAGIPQPDLPHIFEKFRRAGDATTNAIAGTGLGLALVKGLVEQLQGQITATSHPTSSPELSEICFTLQLPFPSQAWTLTSA